MKRRVLCVIAAALAAGTAVSVDPADEMYARWSFHLVTTYFNPVAEHMDAAQFKRYMDDPAEMARMMGYALSLQLTYVRQGTPEHEIWKQLEERSRRTLIERSREVADQRRLGAADRQALETRVVREFGAATIGWHDRQLAVLTQLDPAKAPNFFETLRGGAPPPPPVARAPEPPSPPPLTPPPVVREPAPPLLPPRPPVVRDPPSPSPPTPHPGLPHDAVLGKWTVVLEDRFNVPQNRKSVVVRKAGGSDPTLYEANYIELGEVHIRRGYRVGQLAWKGRFMRERQGMLQYQFQFHSRRDHGPEHERDSFSAPEVITLDPTRPGILMSYNRPVFQR